MVIDLLFWFAVFTASLSLGDKRPQMWTLGIVFLGLRIEGQTFRIASQRTVLLALLAGRLGI